MRIQTLVWCCAVRSSVSLWLPQVEKSLQRIQNGQRNSMYTSQQSVENKVGGVPGWQALLTAVGFRLDSAGTGLPAAVFFPTTDPGDRLQQCSTTLQSLLGTTRCPFISHGKKTSQIACTQSALCFKATQKKDYSLFVMCNGLNSHLLVIGTVHIRRFASSCPAGVV